jgi:hypothetical protein
MKSTVFWLFLSATSFALSTRVSKTPVTPVITLLIELQARIEGDGRMEQKSYDKFACWCEHKLEEKAKAIDDAKKRIEELLALTLKLSGDLGSHGAEIKQLEKDIAENLEAQEEAKEQREKQSAAYEAEKTEAEQCLGALEAATKALTGAGTGKKGFLETLQESELLSVAARVKRALRTAQETEGVVSDSDLEVMRRFVDSPEHFLHGEVGAVAALQLGNNPFGDYAPKSTQIQGILKGMYDAFARQLEKANGEESDKQKSFEEYMATKQHELETLKAALAKETADDAAKAKLKADSKSELDATKEQLKADEKFFEEAKASCKEKASQWSYISRMRTEELQSIMTAIRILKDAEGTFQAASTTFLQLSARSPPKDVYARLRALASKYDSIGLAQIAAEAKTGGHFDKVIVMIDDMIALLRKEEQDDIEHRDRCQAGTNKNNNDLEDLSHDIEKAEETLGILKNKQKETQQELKAILSEIEATKKAMEDRLEMRNEERKAFEQALLDDTKAVESIGLAIASLESFYKNNKMPLPELLQAREPEYTIDDDKAPETSFGDKYKSRTSESGGIIAILAMLSEDFEKEIKTGRAEDAEAQKKYEEDMAALKETLKAQEASKLATEKALTDIESKIADLETLLDMKGTEKGEAEKMGKAIGDDCAWVETHFDSRREKRQKEIDGLMEAKNILAQATGEPIAAAAEA